MTNDAVVGLLLRSAAAWDLTHCEPTHGWPGEWTLIWRAPKFHGKISSSVKSKRRPSPKKIADALESELRERMQSTLRCDAKRIGYAWLAENKIELPMKDEHVWKLLDDALYDLDNKLHGALYPQNNQPPVLLLPSTFGWVLGELCEIRCLVSHLKTKMAAKAEGREVPEPVPASTEES